MAGTDLILRVSDLDVQLFHGLQDDLICIVDIREDDRTPILSLGSRESGSVDELHLLEHRRLATLSGP